MFGQIQVRVHIPLRMALTFQVQMQAAFCGCLCMVDKSPLFDGELMGNRDDASAFTVLREQ